MPNRRDLENEDTEPLEPIPPELAAFAKNPADAQRIRETSKPKKTRQKPVAPVQPMVPSGHGEVTDLPTKRLKRVLEINKAINEQGRFWQGDPFDHLVRSPKQYEYLRRYIKDNPRKAKLAVGEYHYRCYVD